VAEEKPTIAVTCRAVGHLDASVILDATEGHTGRKVRVNDDYALATEWATLGNRDDLLAHPACRKFASLILSAPRLLDPSLVFFRGCDISDGLPTAEEMGPPPQDRRPAAGRYNRDGQPVLYLCDSEEGVRREWCTRHVTGVLYVQRYRLPLSELSIADFTNPPENFVAAVFSKAERLNLDGRGKESYDFSQVVAELVSAHFDGMRIPGVRGARPVLYSNVVLFRPYPDWPKWLEPGSSPYPLHVPVP
jgi:hypothetical protein